VSLIGRDLRPIGKGEGKVWLAEVAKEVEQEIEGKVVSEEEVAAQKRESESATPRQNEATVAHIQPPENRGDSMRKSNY